MIWPGIYDGPPAHYGKTLTAKRYIAVHNTANDATAEQEADYARRRADSVSSHYYVDRGRVLQSLDTDYRAFHAGSAAGNSRAIAYEITGTNAKTGTWWLGNVAWEAMARQMALDCTTHGITPRLLSVEQIQAGELTGIITHDQMRRAWGGTSHTDPGANFPMGHLVALVQRAMEDDMGDPWSSEDVQAAKNRLDTIIDMRATNPKGDGLQPEVNRLAECLRDIQSQAKTNGSALTAINQQVNTIGTIVADMVPREPLVVTIDYDVLADKVVERLSRLQFVPLPD